MIAQELTAKVGQRVTVAMLNDWTAEAKKPARFPACFVRAFSEIVGSDALQLLMLSDRQRHLLELGAEAEKHAEKLMRQRHLLELGEQAERLVLTASRKRKKE